MSLRFAVGLLLLAVHAAGAQLSSETNQLLPFGEAGGEAMSSPSHRLNSSGPQAAAGSESAATNERAAHGLQHVIARPHGVTELGERGDVTTSSVTLQWTAPGVDGTQGALPAGSRYLLRLDTTDANAYSYLDGSAIQISTSGVRSGDRVQHGRTSLPANTTHYVRLWTLDPAGNVSPPSVISTFTTLAPAPVHHEGGPFLQVNATSVTVRWHWTPVASGYRLEASSKNFAPADGVVESSVTWTALASTLTVANLDSGTTWYFRVGSLNWVGVSSYTVLGSTKTRLEARLPRTLVSTYTAISSYSVTVSWDDGGNAASSIYTLQASTASDFTGDVLSSTTMNTSFDAFSLLANTTYHFRVSATTESSTSAYLVFFPTSTLAAPPQADPPAFRQVGVTSATVNWAIVSGTTYQLFAGGVSLTTRPAANATLTGLTPNTTYPVSVFALNHNGMFSQVLSLGDLVTRADNPAAAAAPFQGLHASSFSLRWSGGGNPVGFTTYTVVLTTGPSYPNSLAYNVALDTVSVDATVEGLVGNVTYYAFVSARNHAEQSTAWTLVASTPTRAAPPASLAVAPDEDSFTLTWDANDNHLGFGTTYYAQTSANSLFTQIVDFDETLGLSGLALGLTPNTTYHSRVSVFEHHRGTWTHYTLFGATATLAEAPLSAAVPFAEVSSVSAHVVWDGSNNPVNRTTFTLVMTPGDPFPNSHPNNVEISTREPSAFTGHMAIFNSLQPNTTFWFHGRAVNHNALYTPYVQLGSTVTSAAEPTGAAAAVYLGSVTVSWNAQSAQGFRVRASSTNYQAGTTVFASSTPVDGATSITLTGLEPNTTQHLLLGAYNWANHLTEIGISSVATLALQPGNTQYYEVNETSITVNWKAFPPSPSSATAQGYVVQAATSSDFGGDLVTVQVAGVGLSTLTVQGLDPGGLYWVRVGALNWNGVPHFQAAGSTRTRATPVSWDGGGGNNLWYTANNWNPNGIPTQGSPVTIAANITVFVRATDPPISFSSITLGNPAGTVSAGLVIATTVARGGDVLIHKNSGLTQGTTRQLFFDGSFTMLQGSSLTHTMFGTVVSSVNIKVSGTFDVQAGATIAVSTYGYAGGAANGGNGLGPGAGQGNSASSAGGTGASHGEVGGDSNGGAAPNPPAAYDSVTFPIFAGSGGGGGDGAGGQGGRGGGVVVIEAATFILNGLIEANGTLGGSSAGTANVAAGGGGSGGTINIKTAVLQGGGTVQAEGGAGGGDTGGGDDPGGGGAGGRVAIDVTASGRICDLNLSVAGGAAGTGGTTATAGGNGTVSSTITLPTPALSAVWVTSHSIHWTWTPSAGAANYRFFSQGGADLSGSLDPSVTFYTETALLANTTYTRYVEAQACGVAFASPVAEYATLASTVSALAGAFIDVGETFVRVAWSRLPSTPESQSSQGYRLEASEAADFSVVAQSSETFNVAASTLAVAGLERDTTYFFRVASLNHAGALSPWTTLGSTSTLTASPTLPSEPFAMVAYSSATIEWNAAPVHGWLVEASTTNFGTLSPGGVVYSSRTENGASTRLTVALPPLDLCTPHYFRVGALNWSGAANFTVVGSSAATLDYGVVVSTRDLTIGGLDINTEVVISTSFALLPNAGCPVTYWVKASTINVGSPWVIDTSSGTDTFTLQALLDAAQPSDAAFGEDDKLTDTAQPASATRFSAGQSGVNVPHAGSRLLWLRIGMPKITTTSDPQQIRVTVIANPP